VEVNKRKKTVSAVTWRNRITVRIVDVETVAAHV
jgi:hypothetical protein